MYTQEVGGAVLDGRLNWTGDNGRTDGRTDEPYNRETDKLKAADLKAVAAR